MTVRDEGGSAVLDRTCRTSLPLTVQPRVAETPGKYTVTASLADGETVRRDWSLSEPVDAAWWALAVLVTDGGAPTVQMLFPNDAVGPPRDTLCGR